MRLQPTGSSTILNSTSSAPNARLRICGHCSRWWSLEAIALRSSSSSSSSSSSWRRRHQSTSSATAAAAAAAASSVEATHDIPAKVLANEAKMLPVNTSMEILRTLGKEMNFSTKSARLLLGSGHPMLDSVAKYYTQSEGKRIRPLVVLLMSRATSGASKRPRESRATSRAGLDQPISPAGVLTDVNPAMLIPEDPTLSPLSMSEENVVENVDILPPQRRLAEITELIHTASLLHDDVIDEANTRRSGPSANIAFGNKMAVLAGDFLLGRASVALARLRDAEVVELLATVIANLVEGEFMQLKNTALEPTTATDPVWAEDTLSYYLRKTYLKSASLISKSCRASAVLGHCSIEVVDAAYAYGKNLGMAFQLVDDLLDYTVSADELGKPAAADIALGLVTAPMLFAWKEHEALGPLIGRRFQGPGDIEQALEIVHRSNGLEQTRALAQEYADKAIHAIRDLPPSDAKDGLVHMCLTTITRRQ